MAKDENWIVLVLEVQCDDGEWRSLRPYARWKAVPTQPAHIGRHAFDADQTAAKFISGEHCTLRFVSGEWWVEDHSRNGSLVIRANKERIPLRRNSVPVQIGDTIYLGHDAGRVHIRAYEPKPGDDTAESVVDGRMLRH